MYFAVEEIKHEKIVRHESQNSRENLKMLPASVKYVGSCHCGEVTYEVLAPPELHVYHCNCSLCTKKQVIHFLVPASNFKLLSGHGFLNSYTFNTHQAKHTFCSKCGTQSFFIPRCSPEIMAIVTHCVDSPLPLKITKEEFDGVNWEETAKTLHLPASPDPKEGHSHSHF